MSKNPMETASVLKCKSKIKQGHQTIDMEISPTVQLEKRSALEAKYHSLKTQECNMNNKVLHNLCHLLS